MQKSVFLPLIFISLSLVSWTSIALAIDLGEREQLGEFRWADFLVEPSFRHFEANRRTGVSETGFSLGNTYFSAEWNLDRKVSGRLQVSSLELLKRPSWTTASTTQDFGFSEAYAEIHHSYARLRAGLLPVKFSLEGSTPENELWFPRGFLYEDRVFPMRDIGVQLLVRHRDFFLDTTIHNGEAGTDQDQRVFNTVRIGWGGVGSGLTAGISGSSGYYKSSGSALDTKFRMGNLFFGGDFVHVGVTAEATVGERKSGLSQSQFLDISASLRHQLGTNWGALVKYEHWDANNRIEDDLIRQGLAGLYFSNDTVTSKLNLMYVKNWDEREDRANDEYWVTWRITSLYVP